MESKHLRFDAGAAAETIAHLAASKAESTLVGYYKYMSNMCTLCMPFACFAAGQSRGASTTLQLAPDWFPGTCIIPSSEILKS